LKAESVLAQKGKELAGVAGAGRAAKCDFTGYDRAGIPILYSTNLRISINYSGTKLAFVKNSR
jgi:hypothetical protein